MNARKRFTWRCADVVLKIRRTAWELNKQQCVLVEDGSVYRCRVVHATVDGPGEGAAVAEQCALCSSSERECVWAGGKAREKSKVSKGHRLAMRAYYELLHGRSHLCCFDME